MANWCLTDISDYTGICIKFLLFHQNSFTCSLSIFAFHNSILLMVQPRILASQTPSLVPGTNSVSKIPLKICLESKPLLLYPLYLQLCSGSWSLVAPKVTSTLRVSRTFDNLSQTILMLKSICDFSSRRKVKVLKEA